jgi:hypothetical protein
MSWDGEIQSATIDQFRQGQDGKIHVIDADAGGVVARMKRIDKNLNLRYSEKGDYYVVYYEAEDGKQELVATYQQLDHRLAEDLERLEHKIKQPGYDYAAELDEMDAKADVEANYRHREAIGESAEKLAYAIRKDLHMDGGRITVSKDLKD